MGGSVTVVLREPDGTVHKQLRWTNALPRFVNNVKFVEKSSEHVAEYLQQQHEEMKSGNGILAPQGYGLVVLDQQQNVILTYQDYCSFGTIYAISVRGDIRRSLDGAIHTVLIGDPTTAPPRLGIGAFLLDDDSWDAVRLRQFHEKGKLLYARAWDNETGDYTGQIYPTAGMSLEQIAAFAREHARDEVAFIPDMRPFTIRKYRAYDKADGLKLKDDIQQLGFSISQADDVAWTSFLRE